MAVEVLVLGPPLVVADGDQVAVRGDQAAAVLAVLALRADQPVPLHALIDAAWGEETPARVDNALQAIVTRLRRIVGRDRITSHGTGYRLHVSPHDVDAEALANALESGAAAMRRGDPANALRMLDAGLAHWRDTLLAGCELRGPLLAERVRLDELHATAVEDRIDALLALGGYDCVHEIGALVDQEPLRERRWAQLMLAMYRAGRQADALATYQRLRGVLGDELGIDPSPSVAALHQRILEQDPDLDWQQPSEPARATNVSSEAELVGRTDLVKAVLSTVRDGRDALLVGTGGVGKTTLARAALARLGPDDAPGGAWFVDVSAAASADDVLTGFRLALGAEHAEGVQAVAAALQGMDAVLVLDGCEHNPDAVVSAVEQLHAVGSVRVVATSRRVISLDAVIIDVPGLAPSDAVELFQRAAGDCGTGATEEDIVALADALDRLPLAIELAARRTKYVSVRQMLDRREHLLDVAGGEGGALRNAIEQSWRLLNGDVASVYRNISVFRGSFSLEAAEAAMPARSRAGVLPALVELCGHSLLQLVESAEEPRYRMLDTIRLHACEKLVETGAKDEVERMVAEWVCHLALHDLPAPDSPHEPAWLLAMDAEAPTVVAALGWLAQNDAVAAARLMIAVAQWFDQRARVAEAQHWLEELRDAADELDPVERCRYLGALARVHERRGDLDAARALGDQVIQLAAAIGDRVLQARWLGNQAFLAVRAGQAETAQRMIDDAVRLASESGNLDARVVAENAAGFLAYTFNDVEGAAARWREGALITRQLGSKNRLSVLLGNLAAALDATGQHEEALRAVDEALLLAREVGEQRAIAATLTTRVGILRSLNRTAEASTEASEALALLDGVTDDATTGELLTQITELAIETGDRAAAQAAALHHTELARRNGWDLERAFGLRDQGIVAMQYGDTATAITLFKAAADVLEVQGSKSSHAAVVGLLSEALVKAAAEASDLPEPAR